MELMIRVAALSLSAALLGLLLRQRNAELAALLSMAAIAVAMGGVLRYAAPFQELAQTVRQMLGGREELLLPVLRCLGCAIVTRLGSDLCRDASQAALSALVELAGSFCAFGVSLPLILTLLKRIGAML